MAPDYDDQRVSLRPIKFEIFSYENWYNSKKLPRAFSQKDHAEFMKLIERVAHFLNSNKIEFMLYAGSLLGSWRHWDIIPWDDDFVS